MRRHDQRTTAIFPAVRVIRRDSSSSARHMTCVENGPCKPLHFVTFKACIARHGVHFQSRSCYCPTWLGRALLSAQDPTCSAPPPTATCNSIASPFSRSNQNPQTHASSLIVPPTYYYVQPLTARPILKMTSLSNIANQDEANINSIRVPPPLPPRASQSNEMDAPPSYTSVMTMSSHDPRSSSTQSLVPDPTLENTGRRRILLVYVHGFMGNETSFRSFPAHVHNLVTVTLAETHVVHTKIYPRYRARYSLEQARDQFSAW